MAALFLLIAILLSPPDVARAHRAASSEYRDAIPHAMAIVDPSGAHPEWEHELWRICRRESWCGRFGRTGVHEIDGWVGPAAYLWAVHRGKLNPETCAAHRLADYSAVLEALSRWEAEHGRRVEPLRARIEALPLGVYEARDFATRGGFGQNAARNLWRLGKCVHPTALDDPANAALMAAHTFAGCTVRDGASKRPCTCVEHVRLWVGAGRWDARPLVAAFRRSKLDSLSMQCGQTVAAAYFVAALFERVTATLGA